MTRTKPPLLEWMKVRLLRNIHIAVSTGNNKRVTVGNTATVTLEDNQPIKE